MCYAGVIKSKGEGGAPEESGYRNAFSVAGAWSRWGVETVDKSEVFYLDKFIYQQKMMTIT